MHTGEKFLSERNNTGFTELTANVALRCPEFNRHTRGSIFQFNY